MDFAGTDFIYLSKLKKDKIRKLKKSEENNKDNAPPLTQNKEPLNDKSEYLSSEQMSASDNLDKESDDSDDAYLSVDSNNFNIDLENPQLYNQPMGFMQAPGIKFKKAIDTNVCVFRYHTLEKEPEKNIKELYQCQKCNSYLNKYSQIIPTEEKDKYNWKCEFCFHENKNIHINKENIPEYECIEKCVEEPKTITEENKKEDDTSIIFCLDNSGSMSENYYIDEGIREQFNEIRGEKSTSNQITRLEMVKLSVEKIIKTLLKKSPKVKAGLVTFESKIEVKGDCLSNIIIVRDEKLNDESKLELLGKENKNLINAEINKSSENLIKNIRQIKDEGCTAMGPAIFLSLYLLDKAKIGSRIFVCTDGMSNEGIGTISTFSQDRENAIKFYTKVGNIAKEKGIVISLIAFEDCESEIDILKHMIEISGGDIFRVNPKYILDDMNDFLENKAIATDVEIKMNINQCMTFRDEDKKDIINDGSTIFKKLGNVTLEKETYLELKFKEAKKLADMNDINFDELKNLIFQFVITYKNKNEGKYVRVITKQLKISDNKEEINKQANMNIVSTLQIQKSAKLAGFGRLMDAQAQIHIARNFLNNNINFMNNRLIFNQFNSNMNNFNSSLSMNNMMNSGMNNMMNMNNMMMNNMNNMNMGMNNMMMNNMNRGMNNMNMNMGMNNMMMNNMNMGMNNMNMNMMMNNMNMGMNNMMMNNMNNMNMGMNNMMNSDNLSGQIFSLSNTSERRQNMNFNRLNKK